VIGTIPNWEGGEGAMLFAKKEKGQGLVEYALILALIAIVVIAVLAILGTRVREKFNTIANSLS
jgi:pilus assembly protein Flp/PilA